MDRKTANVLYNVAKMLQEEDDGPMGEKELLAQRAIETGDPDVVRSLIDAHNRTLPNGMDPASNMYANIRAHNPVNGYDPALGRDFHNAAVGLSASPDVRIKNREDLDADVYKYNEGVSRGVTPDVQMSLPYSRDYGGFISRSANDAAEALADAAEEAKAAEAAKPWYQKGLDWADKNRLATAGILAGVPTALTAAYIFNKRRKKK